MLLKKYIGKIIKGQCNGYFGTSDLQEKKIVIIGENYIVAESITKEPLVAYFEELDETAIENFILAWMKGENYNLEDDYAKEKSSLLK